MRIGRREIAFILNIVETALSRHMGQYTIPIFENLSLLSAYAGARLSVQTQDAKVWVADPAAIGVANGITAVSRVSGGWWRWQFTQQEVPITAAIDGQLIAHQMGTTLIRGVVYNQSGQIETTMQVIVPLNNPNQIQLIGINGTFTGIVVLSRIAPFS